MSKVVVPKWVDKKIQEFSSHYSTNKEVNTMKRIIDYANMEYDGIYWKWVNDNIETLTKAIKYGYEIEKELVEIDILEAIRLLKTGSVLKIQLPNSSTFDYKIDCGRLLYKNSYWDTSKLTFDNLLKAEKFEVYK